MILPDENITNDQSKLLKSLKQTVKQIGVDFKLKGLKDDQTPQLLVHIKNVLFITRDKDFYERNICNSE